jgi:hypothetical protein
MSEKRETASADRYQTIPHLAGVIASGRAEDLFFFHKKIHNVNFFVKKEKSTMLPQAQQTSIGSNVRFGSQPRNSCYVTRVTRSQT